MACAFLAALNVAVWGWSVRNGFVFDDLSNILRNTWIKDWALLPQAFLHHAAGFDPAFSTSFYRPMMHVLYAVVYAVAGAEPWAYHLLNVLFHLGATLGVYTLCRTIIGRWGQPARHPFTPLIAATLFAIHPIHTEPVLWIAGITDLSYAAFGVLALLAYLQGFSRARFSAAAGVLLLIALLCKETGAVILLAMAVFEWIERGHSNSWTPRAAAIRLAPAALAFAAYLGLRWSALGSFAPSVAEHARGIPTLAAAASGLFARYVAALVAPVRLTVAHVVDLDAGFSDPMVLAGLLAGASVAAAGYYGRRSAAVVLPLAFAVLPILPVLYIPSIEGGGSVFGERYLYLSVLGVGLGAGYALEEGRRRLRWGLAIALAVMAVSVGWGVAAAALRTRAWSSSIHLWTDAVAKSPDSAAAHAGLCFALYDAGRIPESLGACAQALAIEPARVDARINYATALLAVGRARQARSELDRVLAIRPNSPRALVNRGLACMMLGQPDEAMSAYRRALELDPDDADAHNVMGVALVRSGLKARALEHFERAVRLAPENPEYRDNLRIARAGGSRD